MTKVFKLINDDQHDLELIKQAADIIKQGGLVAFPTETVYGLGANAFDREAVGKIFAAKQRPSWDPVISHVDSFDMLESLIKNQSELLEAVCRAFMPGPLTILIDQEDADSRLVTQSAGKVSLRMPAHPAAQLLIKHAGVPIAAPSANLFGRPSPTNAAHVLEDLDGRIDAVIDDGSTDIGVESTVLDLTGDVPMIMRPGGVTREQLEAVIGRIDVFDRFVNQPGNELSSPGIFHQHYSPKAKVILTEGDARSLRAAIDGLSGRIGVIHPAGWLASSDGLEFFEWGDWQNTEELAERLFLGLRELDSRRVDLIICPLPDEEGLGLAIRDRLRRAASK